MTPIVNPWQQRIRDDARSERLFWRLWLPLGVLALIGLCWIEWKYWTWFR